MAVIPLTLTISLCLVATFVLFFLRESAHRAFSSAEHDAMLPLSDETPTPSLGTVATVPVRGKSQSLARRGRCGCSVGAEGHEDHAPDRDHDQAHAHGSGRAPCEGCRRRAHERARRTSSATEAVVAGS